MTEEKESVDKAVQVLKNFRKSESAESVDRAIWKKTFQYTNNRVDGELGQWGSDIKAELGGRPALSFPEIGPIVNRICGAQRATKLDEKCFPRDDVADPIVAEILTDLIKYVYELPENRVEMQISQQFRNGVICGRGWLKYEWTDEYDPLGEIHVRSVHPRNVYLVGRGTRYDLSDRIGIIEKIPMTKEELKATYPEKYDEIVAQKDSLDQSPPTAGEDYDFTVTTADFWDAEESEYYILRQQAWEYQTVRMLRGANNVLERVEDSVPDSDLPIKPISKRIRKVRVTTVCGNVLLSDELSPYEHAKFDLIPFFPYFDDGVTRGVVQDLIDTQDEKNKRRSQMTHILGIVAKGNYFTKKGVFDDPTDASKKLGGTGQIIEVNTTGSITDAIQAVKPDLTLFPALVQLDAMATAEKNEISGLHPASMGDAPASVKSGVALQALQMPTETIIGEIVENYLETRKMLAQCVVGLIQQYYTGEKKVRVLGDYLKGFVPVELQDMYTHLTQQIMSADPMMDEAQAGEMAGQLIDIQTGAKTITINRQIGEKRLNDVTVGRFDVVIDHVSQNPTTRRGLLFDLLNMRSQGIPIPNKTIVEYSDVRNKQKVISDMENEQMMLVQQAVQEQMQKMAPKMASPQQDGELQNVAGNQVPMI